MPLQVFSDCLYTLANAVAHDQKEEAPASEIGSERIVERYFVDRSINFSDHFEKGIAVTSKTAAHLALQIGRRPTTEFFRVIQNLTHYLAARLWISPQLALDKHG